MKKKYVIAIDGPAGVGKTTTAKLVANKLGYIYIDTGAMYRAVAWKSLKERTSLSDSRKLKSMLVKLDMRIISENARMRILIDGEDITGRLRTRTITELSSKISTIREVRQYLVKIQRRVGRKGGVVIEGELDKNGFKKLIYTGGTAKIPTPTEGKISKDGKKIEMKVFTNFDSEFTRR